MRRFDDEDLTDAEFRECDLSRARLVGVVMHDAVIDGLVTNLVVNGVEVMPYVEAELDRRHPVRLLIRSDQPADLREAWRQLWDDWATTTERVRSMPENSEHRGVDGEWSMVETLRHLVFVHDSWFRRCVLGLTEPFTGLGLGPPFVMDQEENGLDPSAQPSLDEVLTVRNRQASELETWLAEVTPVQLAQTAPVPDDDRWPPYAKGRTVRQCLGTVLDEEWLTTGSANATWASSRVRSLRRGPERLNLALPSPWIRRSRSERARVVRWRPGPASRTATDRDVCRHQAGGRFSLTIVTTRAVLRALLTGAAALVTLGCASCTETGGGPGPSTGRPTASATGTFKSGIDRSAKVTQLSVSFLTTPGPVEMTDGKVHLTYELVLTNVAPVPVRVDRIELHDAATSALVPGTTGRVDLTPLQVFGAAEGVSVPGAGETSVTIAPTTTYIAWVDVAFPQRSAVPATVEHVVSGAVLTPNAPPVPMELRLGRLDPVTDGPVVVGAPVAAGTWYMSEGCCADDTHHRRGFEPVNGELEVPQRYAIDFFKLDDQHRTWVGDPAKLESYLSYRQPILSAAAGTVVAAQDGLPNNAQIPQPTNLATIGETVGNHVIVQIGEGVYVMYAHMDPGSVAVRVGDRVTRGQQLGLIGSSGISTTPHLHFQILSTPTYFPADSPPYAFDSFTLLGRIMGRLWDDNVGLQPTGALPFEATSSSSARANELPLDRDVVQFGS